MKNKIEELLSGNDKISYGQIAKELNIPLVQILREAPEVKKYDVEKKDELFEILTWSQLKIFNGPVGLLNINGFYDLLIGHLDKMVEEGFLTRPNRAILLIADNVSTLLDKMATFHEQEHDDKPLDMSLFVKEE